MPKLKRLPKEGEEMPYDFWNYLVNPITGYDYEPKEKYKIKTINKYHKTKQVINDSTSSKHRSKKY